MVWTKGKIPSNLLLTLAASQLVVPPLANCGENFSFETASRPDHEEYFQAIPSHEPRKAKSAHSTSNSASPFQLDSVLKQGEMPVADFIAQFRTMDRQDVEGSSAHDETFLAKIEKINEVFQKFGKAPITLGGELPQKHSTSTVELIITKTDDGLAISPSHISLDKPEQTIGVKFRGFGKKAPKLFVASNMLEWNKDSRQFIAKAVGRTTLVINYKSIPSLLPITIRSEQEATAAIAAEETLTQLAPINIDTLIAEDLSQQEQAQAALAAAKAKSSIPAGDITLSPRELAYTNVSIRVVDERSRLSSSKDEPPLYFPASGVSVKLIGDQTPAKTDNRGLIPPISVPQNSRMLVSISSERGEFVPSIHEIVTDNSVDQGTLTIKIMHTRALGHLLQSNGLEYNKELGSVCGIVQDQSRKALDGVAVKIDWEGNNPLYFNEEGINPLYFNEEGFIDHELVATTKSGRFCFLNVPAGPAALSFINASDKSTLSVIPQTFFAGHHVEKAFAIDEHTEINTHIASYPSTYALDDTLNGEVLENKSIDTVELLPLDYSEDRFQTDESGIVASNKPIPSLNNRTFFVSRAQDIEPTLYHFNVEDSDSSEEAVSSPVTPLIPHGFVENMLQYADEQQENYIPYNDLMGRVLVEHGLLQGEDAGSTRIKLIDHEGIEFTEAVYFGEKPVRKALFFNVPPGIYEVLVETATGEWLAADTILVYEKMLSYLRTGSPTVFQGELPLPNLASRS